MSRGITLKEKEMTILIDAVKEKGALVLSLKPKMVGRDSVSSPVR